jgi:arylsulfatase A-like enzyme
MSVHGRSGTGDRLPALATAVSIAMAALAAAGCSRPGAPALQPNFVLIVVDALRADHLHYAGYDEIETPNFDALEQRSIWFPNAYATAPWTIPSVASLFVSQLPSRHGVVKWGSNLLPEHTTLVEILQQAGYATGGWTANRLMAAARGFAQGFDEYEMVTHPKLRPDTPPGTEFAVAPASEVTQAALRWLRGRRRGDRPAPFFAYLHYLEPHTPYLCPDGSGEPCRATEAELTRRLLKRDWEFDGRENELIGSLYDVNVARMDAALGELMRALRAEGLLTDTWVIVTADHGEHLGERGVYLHGTTLNQPAVRVPLLLSPPSRESAVVDVTVSLADVAPTILTLAGVAIPDSFTGRSLANALAGRSLPRRPVVTELLPTSRKLDPALRHRVAVIDGRDALLLARDGTLQRFDLSADPGEANPLAASLTELGGLLATAGVRMAESYDLSTEDADISPEMLEHLQALGYLQ